MLTARGLTPSSIHSFHSSSFSGLTFSSFADSSLHNVNVTSSRLGANRPAASGCGIATELRRRAGQTAVARFRRTRDWSSCCWRCLSLSLSPRYLAALLPLCDVTSRGTTLPRSIVLIAAAFVNRRSQQQQQQQVPVTSHQQQVAVSVGASEETELDLGVMCAVRLALAATELLMYSNHAVNFFLYCATGHKFRRQLCAPPLAAAAAAVTSLTAAYQLCATLCCCVNRRNILHQPSLSAR